ncbi:phosphoglucosamine mutase [Rhodopirellula sp. MGV]|uniref:phosphoglucosamine mutase n=1 Tax=Rhodopirellula sp. MGV TaxID=2023130 RepID=UPI000B965F6B|nr:phosphoglucosamine mutase [Rhodopirellula sp. MGV]OYP34548.1 phosphoglucosamine mutase [Rhodopirellula sp. MGV]PNY36736.1 phosphoglucosamine mutase [Rhodopirellula baltica]
MSKLIISVSGLRGIIGETLTPVVAARFVAAFAAQLPAGKIIVGRDGRSSGPMLRDTIVAALRACGRDVIDADVAATPTIGVLVKTSGAAGAVQISASHNPPPYNGIKLFGGDGRVLDAVTGAKICDAYHEDVAAWCDFDKIGSAAVHDDPHAAHLEAVLATVDVDAIRAAKHKVLLDSNHGAGSLLGRRLLASLGCEVVTFGETPDGQFEHVPEPTEENLAGISDLVRQSGCAVGFCQDPDADRLALIDADGKYVGEEYTLALCVRRAMSCEATRGPIVINGATSSMSERIAAEAGAASFRSAVGEANVADMMIANKATYGGEGNGGPIDPRVGYVRDSFVGMAQILDLMTSTKKTLAELADEIPKFAIVKDKASVSADGLPELFGKLKQQYPEASCDDGDGLRLAWPDRWLLVRGSNTEPIVRLIAEAETATLAQELCDSARALLDADA